MMAGHAHGQSDDQNDADCHYNRYEQIDDHFTTPVSPCLKWVIELTLPYIVI